jgi:hypothetical protein
MKYASPDSETRQVTIENSCEILWNIRKERYFQGGTMDVLQVLMRKKLQVAYQRLVGQLNYTKNY